MANNQRIPEYTSIRAAVTALYGEVEVKGRRAVHGGDINDAYALSLSDGRTLFVKQNRIRNKDFFRAEIDGVTALAATQTVSVPHLLAWGADEAEGTAFLLMEYIESGSRNRDYFEVLGRELAAMHRWDAGERYGFHSDNYIGAGYQENGWCNSFVEFFREHRLRPQMKRAEQAMDAGLRKKCDRLLESLDHFLIEPEAPSLLHGDLWGGNIHPGPDGKAWLIDPAVYVGHREADLAMTELFGGFAAPFYEAYREAFPLQPGYTERRDLYNLYHMLNHLNLFGGGYLSSVRGIVNRYI